VEKAAKGLSCVFCKKRVIAQEFPVMTDECLTQARQNEMSTMKLSASEMSRVNISTYD
jgi:hypothetical protein